jgi:GAF domain-containing protein
MDLSPQMAARFKQLNQIGIALSLGHNLGTLLETILAAARGLTNADAGTIYLYDAEKGELTFQIVHNETWKSTLGGTGGFGISLPAIRLIDEDGIPNHRNVASHAALSGETVNIPDAYQAEEYDFSGTVAFDHLTGYRSRSFLTVPMRDHERQITGVLQLINALDPETGSVIPFSPDYQELVESLASQAAVALNNSRLITQLENLFESLIKMVNTAIDDKSPYTKGAVRGNCCFSGKC